MPRVRTSPRRVENLFDDNDYRELTRRHRYELLAVARGVHRWFESAPGISHVMVVLVTDALTLFPRAAIADYEPRFYTR